MKTVEIELDDSVFPAVKRSPKEVAREAKLLLAIEWYSKGMISQGKGASIAALSRAEFIDALAEHNVPVCQVTAEDLRDELTRL